MNKTIIKNNINYKVQCFLSSEDIKNARNLQDICKQNCNYNLMSFLEYTQNISTDFPGFVLAFNNNLLVGIFEAFCCDKDECELYAFVHPDYQGNKIFSHMYDIFLESFFNYASWEPDFYFLISPNNIIAKNILEHYEYQFDRSELSLINYNTNSFNISQSINSNTYVDKCIDSKENKSSYYILYKLYDKQTRSLISSCNILKDNNFITIFSLETQKKNRNKGYGSYLLEYILNECHMKYSDNHILLQVTKSNPALSIYLNHEFQICEEIMFYY